MSTLIEVRVPDLGDFKDVEVVDVLIKPGDTIALEAPLVTLETDKATIDVPSSAQGTVKAVAVKAGDRVSKGSLVVTVETSAAPAAAKTAVPPPAVAAEKPVPKSTVIAPAEDKTAVDARRVAHDVVVPDIGDFKDVEVVDVLVKVGDTIAVDTPLITLETEKATIDVPSTVAGAVTSVAVKKADRVSKGRVILTVEATAQPAGKKAEASKERAAAPAVRVEQPAPAAAAPQPQTSNARPAAPAPIEEAGFSSAFAGPSVRKFARELGVDLARVKGSGLKSRIVHEDVKSWVKQALAGGAATVAPTTALPRVPEVDFAKFGEIEVKPLGRIQKISAARLHASWINLPHVTQFDEADITEMEAKRGTLKEEAAQRGIKLTPLAFVLRACVLALQEMPLLNTSLDASGQNLVYKKYIHLGFAADTPNGLVVPVIRDADRKDIYELAKDLAVLSEKARDGKLSAAQMQGGSFTVSSLGGIGGTAFTPIINAPEVAILGVSRAAMRPVYIDKQFVPRLILPLSLSYDHRVIDGAAAVRFTTLLTQKLAGVKALVQAVP